MFLGTNDESGFPSGGAGEALGRGFECCQSSG